MPSWPETRCGVHVAGSLRGVGCLPDATEAPDYMLMVGLGPRDGSVLSPEVVQLKIDERLRCAPVVVRAVASDGGGGVAVDTCGRVWIWGSPLADLNPAVTCRAPAEEQRHLGRPERMHQNNTPGASPSCRRRSARTTASF